MTLIRIFVMLWVIGRDVLKRVSMLARELLTRAMALPDLLLPSRYALIGVDVSRALLTSCFCHIIRSFCTARRSVLCVSSKCRLLSVY